MFEIKLIILGSGGVGKSALVVQFMQNHFIDYYDPTIEDAYRKQVLIDDNIFLLDVLDTAGQEEYSVMRDQYMRTGDGFILTYSIINRQTFNEINDFIERIYMNNDRDIPILLCGNKIDLHSMRQVHTVEGYDLAQQIGCPFYETSAKLRINTDEIWYGIVREILKKKKMLNKKIEKKKCLIL